jgi:hypothetical protein
MRRRSRLHAPQTLHLDRSSDPDGARGERRHVIVQNGSFSQARGLSLAPRQFFERVPSCFARGRRIWRYFWSRPERNVAFGEFRFPRVDQTRSSEPPTLVDAPIALGAGQLR